MKLKTLMVASGKGGTGKSTISVMLGARLAAYGKGQKVLLIELDAGLRSVDMIADVSDKTIYDLGDVLCGRCSVEKAAVKSPLYPGLFIISAPYKADSIATASLQALCRALQDHFDWVILDTAAGMGEPLHAALTCAQQALLIVTVDSVALRDGRIVSDVLYSAGLEKVRLVINRVTSKTFRVGAIRDVDECIDTVCAQLIGVIPESSAIQNAAANSKKIPTDCLAFTAVNNIACRLEGERIPLAVL